MSESSDKYESSENADIKLIKNDKYYCNELHIVIKPNAFILSDISHLNLSGCALKTLPKELFEIYTLIKLELYDNFITIIPENIGNLVNLCELDINNNELTELPESLYNLTELIELNISS